jgi:hypothetical protein
MKDEIYTVQTPVYSTCDTIVCETVCKPVKETVVRDCKRLCSKEVHETRYRECPRTVCKSICTPVTRRESFAVCKPITETYYQSACRTECRDGCDAAAGTRNVSMNAAEAAPVHVKRNAMGA